MTTATKLPPTEDPRCGTNAGYQAHYARGESACAPCKANESARQKERRQVRTPEQRTRELAARSDAAKIAYRERRALDGGEHDRRKLRERRERDGGQASRQATARARGRYSARTAAETDADFERLHGDGKPCHGCGVVLPAKAFSKAMMHPDGRRNRCNSSDGNGCESRHHMLRRWRKLVPHWLSRGLDPDACAYCLRPIGPGDRDVDHFQPVKLDGPDHPDNLIPACPDCNRGQGGKFHTPPFEWLAAYHPERVDFFRALFPKETA